VIKEYRYNQAVFQALMSKECHQYSSNSL